MIKKEELKLVTEWDKTFPKSDKVDHSKVTFVNRYGITLAADMYVPKDKEGRLPAIAVCGPFGAVKEQCSGLYAQTMAERGFLTIAFDPSFTGESGGNVRYMASPDINTEDFMAAVDFLSLNDRVDPDRIGIIGICGWGGMAINTAALDTRIKETVASTMYDMTRVNAKGYFDSEDSEEARYEKKKAMCAQRLEDLKSGDYKLGGGVVDPLPSDAPFFVKDYHRYCPKQEGIVVCRQPQVAMHQRMYHALTTTTRAFKACYREDNTSWHPASVSRVDKEIEQCRHNEHHQHHNSDNALPAHVRYLITFETNARRRSVV